jgi:hypothetical protein
MARFNWVRLWRKAKLGEVETRNTSLRRRKRKTTKLRKWLSAWWDREPIRRYLAARWLQTSSEFHERMMVGVADSIVRQLN